MAVDNGSGIDAEKEAKFLNNPAHIAIANCCALRPSVDISVSFGTGQVRLTLVHFSAQLKPFWSVRHSVSSLSRVTTPTSTEGTQLIPRKVLTLS